MKDSLKKTVKVTKKELIDSIHDNSEIKNSDLNRPDIQLVVAAFLDEVKKQLCEGKTIELRGFGTFGPKLRNGRKNARNPKTGETHDVDPHYILQFIPGQDFKEALNNLPVSSDEE